MRPLADDEVGRLRERAMGPDPEWAPTLLCVGDDRVRAWTGAAMSVHLARRLGPADTVCVVHALGALRRRSRGRASELPGAPTGAAAIGRAQFLRLGAGVGVTAGLLVAGKVPAFADGEAQSALAWVNKNSENRQVPAALPEGDLQRLRGQRTPPTRTTERELSAPHADAVAAFGKTEAHSPSWARSAPSARTVSTAADAPTRPYSSAEDGGQDFCDAGKCTVDGYRVRQPSGCGVFWAHPRDDDCV